MAIVIGPCWTNFCSQKLKRRILATFDFNRTALRATQPKLHSMFCDLFLKISLTAAEPMSFGQLGAAIWHCWTIICRVPSKCYADKSLACCFKGHYSWSHWWIKNWTDRVGYCMASQGSHLNEIIFHY